jgi:hypothetical protein
MKNKLVQPEYYLIEGDKKNNLGDVLQGLVAKQFLSEDSICLNREKIKSGDYKEGLVIANGWFQHNIEEFPFNKKLNPIYISFHVAKSELLKKPESRNHLKQYSPIGCRDIQTKYLLLLWGIPAYFSGCLTMTSSKLIPKEITYSKEILLVDNVDHPIPDKIKSKLNEILACEIIHLNHDPKSNNLPFQEYVEIESQNMLQLLERYKNAELIITSKLHVAIPCLSLNKKVLFIHPNPNDKRLSILKKYIKIYHFNEIEKWTELPELKFKENKFNIQKTKIEKIIETSIKLKSNSLNYSDDRHLNFTSITSKINSKILNLLRIVLINIPFCPIKFKQTFS